MNIVLDFFQENSLLALVKNIQLKNFIAFLEFNPEVFSFSKGITFFFFFFFLFLFSPILTI